MRSILLAAAAVLGVLSSDVAQAQYMLSNTNPEKELQRRPASIAVARSPHIIRVEDGRTPRRPGYHRLDVMPASEADDITGTVEAAPGEPAFRILTRPVVSESPVAVVDHPPALRHAPPGALVRRPSATASSPAVRADRVRPRPVRFAVYAAPLRPPLPIIHHVDLDRRAGHRIVHSAGLGADFSLRRPRTTVLLVETHIQARPLGCAPMHRPAVHLQGCACPPGSARVPSH